MTPTQHSIHHRLIYRDSSSGTAPSRAWRAPRWITVPSTVVRIYFSAKRASRLYFQPPHAAYCAFTYFATPYTLLAVGALPPNNHAVSWRQSYGDSVSLSSPIDAWLL